MENKKKFSIPYIKKNHLSRINWDEVSKYQSLSEDFIREFSEKLNWDFISQYQNLSEDFIREFEEEVNWNKIARYQKLSLKFIEANETNGTNDEYTLYLDYCKNPYTPREYFLKFYNGIIEFDIYDEIDIEKLLYRDGPIDEKILEKYIPLFNAEEEDKYYQYWWWDIIVRNQNLSEDFLNKHKKSFHWDSLSENLKRIFSKEFLTENKKLIPFLYNVFLGNLKKLIFLQRAITDCLYRPDGKLFLKCKQEFETLAKHWE